MTKLKELCKKIGSGSTPRGGSNSYLGGPFSLIRSQNVLDFEFSKVGIVRINDEQARALNNVAVESGDILLNITGDSVARCCQVDSSVLPARVNQHVCIIRPDFELLDPAYLKYFLLNPIQKNHLLSLASSGATRNALTKAMIEELDIPEIPVQTQRAIGSILSALDEKIKINQKIIQTIEGVAKNLFKSWFVNFDPVRDKLSGRSSALNSEINELFASETVHIEGREIPRGWKLRKISDFGEVVCGKTPPTNDPQNFDGNYPFITIPDMRDSIANLGTERTVSDVGAKILKGKLLPKGSICISCIATPGLVTLTTRDSFTNQQINAIIPNKPVQKEFLLFAMTQMGELIGNAGSAGSIYSNLSTGRFKELTLPEPTDALLKAYSDICAPMIERILLAGSNNRTLSSLRDALLPKLITGYLKVSDAERLINEEKI